MNLKDLNITHISRDDVKIKVSSNALSGIGGEIYKMLQTLGTDVLNDSNYESQEIIKSFSFTGDDNIHNKVVAVCEIYNREKGGAVRAHCKRTQKTHKRIENKTTKEVRYEPLGVPGESVVSVVNKKTLNNKTYHHDFSKKGGKPNPRFHFGKYYRLMK